MKHLAFAVVVRKSHLTVIFIFSNNKMTFIVRNLENTEKYKECKANLLSH